MHRRLAVVLLALLTPVSACASPLFVSTVGGMSAPSEAQAVSPPGGPEVGLTPETGSELRVEQPDVILRVDVHDGYDRSEIVSFDADGWVVRAADTSVYAPVEAYSTWRISPRGLQRVLRAVDELGVREAPAGSFGDGSVGRDKRAVGLELGDGWRLTGSGPRQAHAPGGSRFERLWALANKVVDPAWYGRDLVEAPRPWQPSMVGVLAGAPEGPAGSPLPWPLDRSIRELGAQTPATTSSGPVQELCLTGEDARRVFGLLTPGQNSAHVLVSDGGELWELDVFVHLPAYHLGSSPCVK